MKKLTSVLCLGFGVTLVATTVLAGARYSFEITVDPYNKYAYGSVGSARASQFESNQLIGCYTYASEGEAGGRCAASNYAGTYRVCTVPASAAATMLPVIASIGPQSYLYFAWDDNAYCTSVQVINNSFLLPATP